MIADVGDGPADRPADDGERLGERQQAGTGDLVELAGVAVVGQRRGRDVGDVVDVDERLGDVGDGQRHGAVEHLARRTRPR